MSSAEPLVSFLIAGVQKGGTTALFDYLRLVDGVRLPTEVKEAHFFDDEEVDWSNPDLAKYHALFAPVGPPVCGEATPIYCYWPRSLQRIAVYNPAMRLILVFRDPVARAWSHWRMETRRGWETEPFGWCIREGRGRVAAAPDGAHRVYSYVERGFYAQQLRRVLDLFDRSQLLLLRSEDLRRSPARTVAEVCAFLGAPAPVRVLPELRSNAAPPNEHADVPPPEDAAYLRALYKEEMLEFGELSKLDVEKWMQGVQFGRLAGDASVPE